MSRMKIIVFGVLARLSMFIFQIIISNLLPDWRDPNNFDPIWLPENRTLDGAVGLLVNGYYTWDVKHILTVSSYGYIYEKELAFYPLYPMTIKLFTNFIPRAFVSEHYLHLCCGLMINFILFLVSLDRLYMLTRHLFTESVAMITAVLFCISPATIHLTVPYTEMLYFTLTLHGLYLLEVHSCSVAASMILGMSAITRSNGLLNFGFIAYHLLWPEIRKQKHGLRIGSLLNTLIKLTVNFMIFITLFVLHSHHVFERFCAKNWTPSDFPSHMVEYARTQPRGECRLPSDGKPPWCTYTIPVSYQYVQSHYWELGFFSYYRLSKVFCFLMAGPVMGLTVHAVIDYWSRNRNYCLTLGLGKCGGESRGADLRMFVYVVHIAGLLLTALPYIHIEVMTRFLFSASPFLYWYAARLASSSIPPSQSAAVSPSIPASHSVSTSPVSPSFTPVRTLRAILPAPVTRYFLIYTLVGTAAFVNGLPWT